MNLSTIKTLLLDGDGVLWHNDKPNPRLVEFFDVLSNRGLKWALLSNNASLSVDDFVTKFQKFGIAADRSNVINSMGVTTAYLAEKYPVGTRVYVVGHTSLKDTISRAGLEVVEDTDSRQHIQAVIAGIDRDFSYARLAVASRLVRNGAEFVATNTDATYPTSNGLEPGAGSIIAAIEVASGKRPLVMGKPQVHMFKVALNQLDAEPNHTVMVGDRIETDILGAKSAGLGSILVLSGVASRDDVENSDVKPDLIVDDIGMLADSLNNA